ncbi:MAG: acetyl-CoA C-acetyltransferase [Clostridiales bacterium]|nr:acetyl-CoA C-acetyltransferase [Clostridiales bacterium]
MKKVYIVDGKRTPIGSFLGGLKSVGAADLGAHVVKNLLAVNNIPAEAIDEVIVGNVLSAGAGQGVARQVALKAGIPHTVPAYAVNMVCGSGMKAVINAYAAIQAGAGLIIAGGAESMSNAPYLLTAKSRQGIKMGEFKMVDHMIFDALTDAYSGVHMGITAENVAAKHGITREEQDAFAYGSQQKAIAAVDGGAFKDEIIPLEITEGKNTFVFENDEYPNRGTSPEKLAKLRPAFKTDGTGTVTAGNASGLNDGASFVIVAGEEAVAKYKLSPLAELIATGQGGVDPQLMGLGPVPAIKNALAAAGLKIGDIDYLELNEAFAAQSLGVVKELSDAFGVKPADITAKCNINGGAIALGHPVGASGNRILVTLLHILKNKKAGYGLASLCIGGGMGTAVIVKNLK